jgi:hypothetical protein
MQRHRMAHGTIGAAAFQRRRAYALVDSRGRLAVVTAAHSKHAWCGACVSLPSEVVQMRAVLVCLLALVACLPAPDSPNPPTDGSNTPTLGLTMRQDDDDVASIVASNLSLSEMTAMKASVDLSYGRVPTGMTEDTPNGLAAGTGSISGMLAGLAYSLAYECHTPDHVVIPCNGAEDQVRLVVKYSGADLSMDGVNAKGVFYVRDVNVQKPLYGGTGSTSFTAALMTGAYTISFTEASANLLFDPNTPSLPTSGTDDVTLTVHRTRDGTPDRNFNVSAHLEVTGTDAAALTLDGSESYGVTLSTGVAVHQ